MRKIVIAEDDLASRKVLSLFISKTADYEIVAEAVNGEELIRHLIVEKPDIAIVDIGMPLLNGMEAIKSCKELLPDLQVIFLTGHDEYAMEAFDINAADYIIKPIERGRLIKALDRASLLGSAEQQGKSDKREQNDRKLVLKHYNNFSIIPFEEIIFIEKIDRKTSIHTKANVYQNTESLSDLLQELSSDFIQAHRSYIINMKHLSNIEARGQSYYASFLNYSKKAKISKHHLKEVRNKLNHH
ncbi:LytR/AlgR family response regulator transcription factor [Bacillus sp. AK031]